VPKLTPLIAAALLAAACSGTPAAAVQHSPSPVTGGLTNGLVAYIADGSGGVGVLDPSTGKFKLVAPFTRGLFRILGPVWGPAPGVDHPVIYFTLHDDRTPERRNQAGVVPWDWIFRVDPFTGTIEPVAASQDSQSEGPIGLVANSHYLAMSYGCCTSYEVDALDLTKAGVPLKALTRPPAEPAFFTEGIAPGDSGLIAVRGAGTGAWYWLNADAGVLNPFPIKPGPDDGPIAISPDGTMAAVALPSQGALLEPINSGLPIASPTPSGTPSPVASTTPKPSPVAPKHVNSRILHPDALSFSPDGSELAMAVNLRIDVYKTDAPDGPPVKQYLKNITGLSWSAAMPTKTFADVKTSPGPQPAVDALLATTKLPAAADTPANRAITQVYMWEFDSSKPSPISSITDATQDVLSKYPPMAAGVVYHHWAPSDTWALLGGCYRYRVVITGSIAPVAATIGLTGSDLCSATSSPSAKSSPT
jgi:hypothetical protein